MCEEGRVGRYFDRERSRDMERERERDLKRVTKTVSNFHAIYNIYIYVVLSVNDDPLLLLLFAPPHVHLRHPPDRNVNLKE